jgi:hypothetical protein
VGRLVFCVFIVSISGKVLWEGSVSAFGLHVDTYLIRYIQNPHYRHSVLNGPSMSVTGLGGRFLTDRDR